MRFVTIIVYEDNMQIKIKDFGKIKDADIELSGLTLIAGSNDTGKSTVGKCLFALIKSISNYPQYYNQIVTEQLYKEFLNPLRLELRGRLKIGSRWSLSLLNKVQDINDDKDIETSFMELYSVLKDKEIDEKIEKINKFIEFLNKNSNAFATKEILKKACDFFAKTTLQKKE